MMSAYHNLKLSQVYFDDVRHGNKTFEVRFDDRAYAVGDVLCLREFDHSQLTGRSVERRVTYVLTHREFPDGIQPGYVVLGIAE